MCLIAFALGASPSWPLVIASNRDEFLMRPTLPLARWRTASGQEIISGRDLHAGGTWLGMTPGGRVAFVTNVREVMPRVAPRSRGELVTRWLETNDDVPDFLAALQESSQTYGGFNLVVGDVRRMNWCWMTNRSATGDFGWQAERLKPGIYGLSNAALDTPWPKTVALKRALTAALATQLCQHRLRALEEPLWSALASRERAALEELPATGVSLTWEKALSSAFVDFPEQKYGTRSSNLLLVKNANKSSGNSQIFECSMRERSYKNHLEDSGIERDYGDREFRFFLGTC